MTEATLSSKNQIVIPREAREALGVKPGDKILVQVLAGKILLLEKPKSYAQALRGLGSKIYPKDYLRKERDSWKFKVSIRFFGAIGASLSTAASSFINCRPTLAMLSLPTRSSLGWSGRWRQHSQVQSRCRNCSSSLTACATKDL